MARRCHSPPTTLDSARKQKKAIFHAALNKESSESCPSDASSIYNAVRASSGLEDIVSKSNGTSDSRMAANMKMFVSPASDHASAHPSKPENRSKCHWWHARLLSDSHIRSPKGDEPPEKMLLSEDSQKVDWSNKRRQRKTASLNDADARLRAPKWLGSLASPASPIIPTYPPPVRPPTPPGLPSFGTEEAILYSARFSVQSVPANGQRRQCSHALEGNRVESYGESFRRFFGISSSAARTNRRACTVVRAADGTAVQGRFPHRQSAHGVSAGNRLDNHPFHRRNLSMAQCGSVNADGGVAVQSRTSDMGHYPNVKRQNSTHLGTDCSVATQPALVSPTRPAHRCESHRWCSSPRQETRTTSVVGISTIPDSEPPDVSLAQMPSPAETTLQGECVMFEDQLGPWLHTSRIVNSCFCCFLGPRGKQDNVYSNTVSNDTYTTARSQFSNGSSARYHHVNNNSKKGPAQELGRWCSNVRTSFQAFFQSLNYGSSTWLDQAREPL